MPTSERNASRLGFSAKKGRWVMHCIRPAGHVKSKLWGVEV